MLDDTKLWVYQYGMWSAVPLDHLYVEVECGLLWAAVSIKRESWLVAELDGISNARGMELGDFCTNVADQFRTHEAGMARVKAFKKGLPRILVWSRKTAAEMVDNLKAKRLIGEEHIRAWLKSKPAGGALFEDPVVQDYLARRSVEVQRLVSFWHADTRKIAAEQNEKLLQSELRGCKEPSTRSG